MARARGRKPAAPELEETFDTSDEAAVEIPQPETAGEPAGYRVTKWAGLDNYECERCPFATLDGPRIREHVAHAHP